MTNPGTKPETGQRPVPEFPSIRQRRPALFWTIIAAVGAMVLPLIAGLIQVLL